MASTKHYTRTTRQISIHHSEVRLSPTELVFSWNSQLYSLLIADADPGQSVPVGFGSDVHLNLVIATPGNTTVLQSVSHITIHSHILTRYYNRTAPIVLWMLMAIHVDMESL